MQAPHFSLLPYECFVIRNCKKRSKHEVMHPEDLENQSHREVRSPHIGTAFHADRV